MNDRVSMLWFQVNRQIFQNFFEENGLEEQVEFTL